MSISSFYNYYHAKNRNKTYHKIIDEGNFTYFHTLKYLKKIEKMFKGKKLQVLDVGCGVGTIDLFLAKRGHTVTGIDISPDAIQIAQDAKEKNHLLSVQFHVGNVEKVKTSNEYDLVICSEVIEHVKDDQQLLHSLYTLVKDDSVILLTTPSLNAPLYKLGMLKKFDEQVGHLRRYSPQNLRKKVEKAGFTIVFMDKNEGILRNSLFTFRPMGYFIKGIRGPLVPLFHAIDTFFVRLLGESDLVVIAKKTNT